MNLTNYHSHCSFCDGKAPAEDFVKLAIAKGFKAYGISSHAPLPFDTRWTLSLQDVPAYMEELKRLKNQYKGVIEIYAGMEIDYLNELHHPGIEYFQKLPLDYRIGSVHLLYTPDGHIVDTDTNPENFRYILENDFHGDVKELVNRYIDASIQMVEQGGFDFVGHADKISYNAGLFQPGIMESNWYQRRIKEYFALIAEKGVMLEVNTKVYAKKGVFFPHVSYFQFFHSLGIPVLVNSDAHFPELINDNRYNALKLLYTAGYKTVRELIGGQWQDIAIEI